MGMQMIMLQVRVRLIIIVGALVVHGSAGYNISPRAFSAVSPTEDRKPSVGYHRKSLETGAQSPGHLHNGPISLVFPPNVSAPVPRAVQGLVPSISPDIGSLLPPQESASPLQPIQGFVPSALPRAHYRRAPYEPAVSPKPGPPSRIRKRYGVPVAAPPMESFDHLSPVNHSPAKGLFPVEAPAPDKTVRPSNKAFAPSKSSSKAPERRQFHSPAPSPSFYKHKHANQRANGLAPTSIPSHPPASYHKGLIITPAPSNASETLPKKSRRHKGLPHLGQGPSISPVQYPVPPTVKRGSFAPVPSPAVQSGQRRVLPPKISPPSSLPRKPKTPLSPSVQTLPPPPPNLDCTSLACVDPYTNSPPGSPCACVLPMQVELCLSVALYTFFPLVSELAAEIAAGVFMRQSQVHIMGANAASQQPEKTIVLINLVPLGVKFDNTTAFMTYEKFWHKQIAIKASYFGDYEVLYVKYPGLPPSPPSTTSSITTIDGGPLPGHDNNGRTIRPLGVDVRRKQKGGLGGGMIAIIVLLSVIAIVFCVGAAWVFLLKCGRHSGQPASTIEAFVPSLAKPSGAAGSMMFGSGASSASLSFGSSFATYTGTARTFSAGEIERATDNFDDSRILGEGGFGRVYSGTLDDGTKVAVKVLKRDDQQGGREFLAEVEMLSRLHHRNLVKLIGICTEDNTRCLVYELIPNGSVESHLHGSDKEASPLDWGARIKIALGAARGLAYLHEDSSPRVIHRDFKSSNILLEHDFTPKVSDFGLARTALDEGNKHVSTRVMGTFGYVAPEYAMTGHLLVKSDVYSYGVVLLELLTGRKPVDMSQPQGQENLVAWARPLLTSKEGLEAIVDPALGSNIPFDSVAKVAAIASMCVQPEVSHRPFMGEVVQALKLVCNECGETKRVGSDNCSRENLSIDLDARVSTGSGQIPESTRTYYAMPVCESSLEDRGALSALDVFSTSARHGMQVSGSFRRHSSSGPLRTGRGMRFWQRLRGMTRGSASEHGVASRFWAVSR